MGRPTSACFSSWGDMSDPPGPTGDFMRANAGRHPLFRSRLDRSGVAPALIHPLSPRHARACPGAPTPSGIRIGSGVSRGPPAAYAPRPGVGGRDKPGHNAGERGDGSATVSVPRRSERPASRRRAPVRGSARPAHAAGHANVIEARPPLAQAHCSTGAPGSAPRGGGPPRRREGCALRQCSMAPNWISTVLWRPDGWS